MVSNNRGNEEYPSSSSFRLQRHDECPLKFAQNEAEGVFNNGSWAGADPVSTNMPLSGASYSWRNMHVNHQPYTHVIPETVGSLAGLDNSIGSQYPRTVPNYLNGRSNFASRPVPDVACLEGNNKEVSPSQICDNIVAADNMVNSVTHFSGFLNPQVNRNFTLNGRRGVHPVTMKGGEVNRNHIYGSQDPKNFVSLRGSTPKFHHSQISGGTNNVDVEAHPIGSGKIDRNFLTLGVGGPADASLKFDPISEDISNNLVKAVSLQSNTSHFQSGHRSSSPLVHNSARGFQPIRNIGGCSNLTDDAAGMTSANNILGVTGGNDAYLSSNSFHYVQKPQVERQHDLPRPSSIRNLGIIGNMDSRYANINLYDRFQGNNAASSGPFASSPARFIDARQSGFPGLSSESAKLPSLPTQPTDQPECCHAKPFQNFSSESSMVSPLVGPRGSFLREGRSARFSSAHRGGGLFSKRPGIHVNDIRAAQVAQHRSYPSQVGVQTGGQLHGSSSIHLSRDLSEPAFTKGQELPFVASHRPFDTVKDPGGPSLKRFTVQSPPYAPRAQRRKMTLEPSTYPSLRSQLQTASAVPLFQHAFGAPVSLPVPAPHIKWQGFDGPPKPTGVECPLCKRDLAFTSDSSGSAYESTALPAVAVLPCGHSFHDHCLQFITPEDQAKDPPCIPCAVGEI